MQITKHNFAEYWMIFTLIALSVSPYFLGLIVNSLNILLVAVLVINCVLLLFSIKKLNKKSLWGIELWTAVLLSVIIHLRSFRMSTILYSGLFLFSFLFYDVLLRENQLISKRKRQMR